jgi:putative sterol carrier protein
MADPTAEFFGKLAESGHQPFLEKTTGTLRIDLANGKRIDPWLITITKGDVAVSRVKRKADCVAQTNKALFDGLVSGKQNALASMLRGEIEIEGNVELMVLFQRLFPGEKS